MASIEVSGKSLKLPILIPSISSFETQIQPLDALRLQLTLQEPVSLVSAFDLAEDTTGELAGMCRDYRKLGVMFLDSGGYEVSRRKKYAAIQDWSIERFLATAQADIFDYAFSFDQFPDPAQQTWRDYADSLDALLNAHNGSIPDEKLIPVIHLSDREQKARFDASDAIELVRLVAELRKSPFVAVTERELGDGLSERVGLVRQLTAALKDSGVKLHLLGCGNPLSFAAFVEAGAHSCDGLEWCRTYCSSDMRLYHFQHSQNIGYAIQPVSFIADMFIKGNFDYYLKTSVINLNNFSHFVRSIQEDPSKAIASISRMFGEEVKI